MSNFLSGLEKISKYYRVAAVGWISRCLLGFVQIISIPILSNCLGADLYAVFVIITGLQGWFLLVDFGIGSSLQNYISEARANNEDTALLNSNAVIVSLVLLVVGCTVFVCISPVLQYLLLHKIVPTLAVSQHYVLILVGLVYIAMGILGISHRVLFANHKGYWAYFYQGVGPVVSVAFISVMKYINADQYRLLIALLSWLLPQLIFFVFSYVQVFSFRNILKNANFRVMQSLFIRGIKFWGFAVAVTFILSIDYIVVAQTLTARDIITYSILSKVFALIIALYNVVLMAVWPKMAELFVKKQWIQANEILIKNTFIAIFSVVVYTLMFLFFRRSIVIFLAPKMDLTLPVISIILFGVYAVLRVWTDSYAVALQSQNRLKIFWIYMPIQVILGSLGMYFFSVHYGINGILVGLVLSFMLTAFWVLPVSYFKYRIGQT